MDDIDSSYADPSRTRRIALVVAGAIVGVIGIPWLAFAALGQVDAESQSFAVLMVLNGLMMLLFGAALLAFPRASLRTITDIYRQWPREFRALSLLKSMDEPWRSQALGSWAYVAFAGGFAGFGLASALSSVITLLR